ncbi:MAG: hypothetical protein BWY85_02092 [Firmicutes bacterium ADurb.Bin506]|nr:MAG: hypothetical protein BWY85_02092 [Firmicutes bacterium ADurb.Bin506]
MTPPTAMTGAENIMLNPMNTAICICWTSLVVRVMSEGAPNWFTSASESVCTFVNTARRRSRPKPMDERDVKNTATMEQAVSSSVTRSMKPPTRSIRSISPLAIPSLMILALRSGRYKLEMDWISTSTLTSVSCFQ